MDDVRRIKFDFSSDAVVVNGSRIECYSNCIRKPMCPSLCPQHLWRNELCPLCCEELDMSDRQFFPCKCGYQVCMWCWHRIRESESGLCPACRTPYGDDPHEFSAVDVEEVVRANKEKAAAEKREKERLRQQRELQNQQQTGQSLVPANVSANYNAGSASGANLSSADLLATPLDAPGPGSNIVGTVEKTVDRSKSLSVDTPKDRSQLANMRVIRRDLVYAVGLPPAIATEEILKKPEYFGQYGRVSKIVINRNYSGNGDPRRASASAYVTFQHKEDTLACILALDGFFLENRNIRASYGTSKYCSAFIKNVRCNNPDCTYLHYMGEPEDNFTKQEIQAGYVTSGRDVLARQQAQMAAAASINGTTRRRVGGGGPSGTGKVPTTPIFPAPVYEEPVRETKGTGFPTAAGPKPTRATSVGSPSISTVPTIATGFAAAAAAGVVSSSVDTVSLLGTTQGVPVVSKAARQVSQQAPSNISPPSGPLYPTPNSSNNTLTAASVVAATSTSVNVHSTQQPIQQPHLISLTPLTPLKRAASLPSKAAGKPITKNINSLNASISPSSSLATYSGIGAIGSSRRSNNSSPTLALHSASSDSSPTQEIGVIGGLTIIGGNSGPQVIGTQRGEQFTAVLPGLSGMNVGFGALGSSSTSCWSVPPGSNSGLSSKGNNIFSDAPLDNDIWGTPSHSPFRSNVEPVGPGVSGNLVGRMNPIPTVLNENGNSTPGGVIISGSDGKPGKLSKNPFTGDSGSCALASLLGIDLPTGSGSLRESSSQGFVTPGLPVASSHAPAPFSFSCVPIGGLDVGNTSQHRQPQYHDDMWSRYSGPEKTHNVFAGNSFQQAQMEDPGPIGYFGSSNKRQVAGFGEYSNGIGGLPVGISSENPITSSIGRERTYAGNHDIALLQNLLPGVHITRGNPAGSLSSSDSISLRGWGGNFGGNREAFINNGRNESAGVVGIGRHPTSESNPSWMAHPSFMGGGEHESQQRGPNIW